MEAGKSDLLETYGLKCLNNQGLDLNAKTVDEDPARCKRCISALVLFRRHFRLSLSNNFYCDILHLYNIVIAT